MPLCDRCDLPGASVEIGDEIYHASCANTIRESDRDYQSVLDTYRELPGSSAVERPPVKRNGVGSIPTPAAKHSEKATT
jgi:hypothetical protein